MLVLLRDEENRQSGLRDAPRSRSCAPNRATEETSPMKTVRQKIVAMRASQRGWFEVCAEHAKMAFRKDIDATDKLTADERGNTCYVCDEPATHEYSPNLVTTLNAQVKDMLDRTRYMVGERFGMYYKADENTFTVNHHETASIFKARKVAEAVAKTMGGLQVVKVKVDKKGALVKSSLPKREIT